MTTIHSLSSNNEFFVDADATGNLDFRVSNSKLGIALTSNNEASFGSISVRLPTANINSPEIGMLRFNSSNNKFEGYNGNTWVQFIY
jgi:hypothetical protein